MVKMYYEHAGEVELIPEQRLLLEILQQAITDAFKGWTNTPIHIRLDACEFLLSRDPRELGAVWCCDMVGIDYQWLRKKLKAEFMDRMIGFRQLQRQIAKEARLRAKLHAAELATEEAL